MSDADVNPVDAANNAVDLDKQPHDRSDVDLLYRIYMGKRVAYQTGFYESRMRENQFNADFTFTAGALVMTLSSLIATISATAGAPSYLSLLSAILPAFAALLGAFRQIYGWERQINIYRDSLLGLERVKLVAPDDERLPLSDLQKIYPELVSSSETVFTGEVNQWGQFILDKDKGSSTSDAQSMTALIGELDLTDEQRSVIAAVLSSGKDKSATSTNLLASVSTSTTVTASASTKPATKTDAAAPPVVEISAARNVETLVAGTKSDTPSTETPADTPATPTPKTRKPRSSGGVG